MSEACYLVKLLFKRSEYLSLEVHLVDNQKKAQFFSRLPFQSVSCDISVLLSPYHALESFDKVNISTWNLITFTLFISSRHMPVLS